MSGAELDHLLGIGGLHHQVAEVVARIEWYLDGDRSPIAAPSTRVAAAGGKRLRPALAIACADLGDPQEDRLLDAAVAAELVQVGSLVHDDIFERAATRRGTPTINAVEGEDVALMAGDYILAKAGAAAAASGPAVASAIARTVEQLCLGQVAETLELYDTGRTIESHLASIKGKTAALFSCSCRVGAICGGLPEESTEALSAYGEAFGMGYQLLDDVLDLLSTEALLGKPVNIDIRSGVYTLPVLLALNGPEGEGIRPLLEARAHDAAREAVVATGTIDQALDEAQRYARHASELLLEVPGTDHLRAFPERYIDWALDRFID